MSMRMGIMMALGAIALMVSACSTPQLEYNARVPAGSPVVAEYQTVAVDRFRGPEGYWYAEEFEQMVASAYFDGRPWFQLATSYGQPEAVFRGVIDMGWLEETHRRNVVSRCVEYDGPFDCERRRDMVEDCVRYEVQLSAVPELVDLRTGNVVWRERYPGGASDEVCHDVGYVEDVKHGPWERGPERRSWGGRGFGNVYGGYIVDDLIRDALIDTLAPIRSDIAPKNVRAQARLIKEAIDPEVRADPRFEQAIEAAKDDNAMASCALWNALAADYPNAPAVKFNTGACLEASGDYAGAQAVYAEVNLMPMELPDVVLKALRQIDMRRAGEAEIDRLLGAPPVPVEPGS